MSRTTGFQVKVGSVHNPMAVPVEGSIVGWSITLGKPSTTQIKFFNTNEGGEAEAGIAVLRPQKSPNLTYKLIASGPLVKLKSYFGKTVQFPLERTIKAKKGDVIALSVPTWAPVLALGFGNDTSWRASRQKKLVPSTSSQTVQSQIGPTSSTSACTRPARLTYSATLISTP